jgi:hypothetical protein
LSQGALFSSLVTVASTSANNCASGIQLPLEEVITIFISFLNAHQIGIVTVAVATHGTASQVCL